MRSNDFAPITFNIQIGDLELYTSPDLGFVGAFAVTPKTHSHPCYEIISVVEGELIIRLFDNRIIKLEKGMLCVIPPKCYHCTCAEGKMPKMLAVRFSYRKIRGDEKIYDSFSRALEQIVEPTCFDAPDNVLPALLKLREEMSERKSAWNFVCKSLFVMLYIDVLRLLSEDKIENTSSIINDSRHSRYYHIEMWFAENLAKHVTEGDLAQKMSLSKRQLSRVFADIYGMSFRDKLTEVRLHRAAQLLEQTELNVDKIALAVGYRSFSGFHRAFVKFFGCTPFEYRKNR